MNSPRFPVGKCSKTLGATAYPHDVIQPVAGIDQRIPDSAGIGAIVLDEENILQRTIPWRPNPWAAPIESGGWSGNRTLPNIDLQGFPDTAAARRLRAGAISLDA